MNNKPQNKNKCNPDYENEKVGRYIYDGSKYYHCKYDGYTCSNGEEIDSLPAQGNQWDQGDSGNNTEFDSLEATIDDNPVSKCYWTINDGDNNCYQWTMFPKGSDEYTINAMHCGSCVDANLVDKSVLESHSTYKKKGYKNVGEYIATAVPLDTIMNASSKSVDDYKKGRRVSKESVAWLISNGYYDDFINKMEVIRQKANKNNPLPNLRGVFDL